MYVLFGCGQGVIIDEYYIDEYYNDDNYDENEIVAQKVLEISPQQTKPETVSHHERPFEIVTAIPSVLTSISRSPMKAEL